MFGHASGLPKYVLQSRQCWPGPCWIATVHCSTYPSGGGMSASAAPAAIPQTTAIRPAAPMLRMGRSLPQHGPRALIVLERVDFHPALVGLDRVDLAAAGDHRREQIGQLRLRGVGRLVDRRALL